MTRTKYLPELQMITYQAHNGVPLHLVPWLDIHLTMNTQKMDGYYHTGSTKTGMLFRTQLDGGECGV